MGKAVLTVVCILGGILSLSPARVWATDKNKEAVTFTRDIAPILQSSCQECHHRGGIAPMPLVDYEQVRPWARAIKEQVLERSMPPFHAAGPLGRFVGDPRLTDEQIRKISLWVDSGSPKGNPADLPPPCVWKSDWKGGHPDLILTMANPYRVKSGRSDDYPLFVLDYVLPEDTWIKGIEVRPGNRTVVHHANVYIVPADLSVGPDGRMDDVFDPVTIGGKFLTAWKPGRAPLIWANPIGLMLPKGSRFAIQMHYAPSQQEALDQTSVGFYFSDGLIQKQSRILYGGTRQIEIPPGEANYQIVEKRTFSEDALVMAFTCHMHLRGKSFIVRFHYPDGRVETAFLVAKYSVNWQELYVLAEPMRAAKGTVVEYISTWDNSGTNRLNPDPTKVVRWGDRATDEMMDGYVSYVASGENLNIRVRNGRPVTSAEKPSEKRR
jgi:hypothetical protein